MEGAKATFVGVTQTGTDKPESDGILSLGSSLGADSGKGPAAATPTPDGQRSASSNAGSASAAGSAASASAANTAPTTLLTSASTGSPGGSATASDIISGTATNAASNTSGAVTVSEKSCDSISCSSGLKAAIVVPVVLAAVAGIFLFFFFARRRRRRAAGGVVESEKTPKKKGKKWSRHLRVFSFDAELLMGGRYSSTNSIRSRDPSVRSAGNSSRQGTASIEPSLHSIEEVAPPYRDAISHAQPGSPLQNRPISAAGGVAGDPILRAASTATAPPPYRSVVPDSNPRSTSPVSGGNPFSDSAPVSPIEGSPFNDPPDEQRPALSRGSSLYQSVNTDDGAPSDAGSIQEAQVGRRVSVRGSGTAPSNGS
ncbi:hypothetical protein PV08_03082 [Exophiala spinifera]|uniref:Uncharacterized protein n=1 Tax=Exophiala spinifera TaxID=91928 RepID=A0A0D2BIM9_9EURO|nr:uncharacterized protein PV08_03082 [Exophiala spinifera]KIW18793.1 hypothetical protein PV08_03082 [Exophiala spinifera]